MEIVLKDFYQESHQLKSDQHPKLEVLNEPEVEIQFHPTIELIPF